MIIDGGIQKLTDNLFRQLSSFWGDIDENVIADTIPEALMRMEAVLDSMSQNNKYIYKGSSEPVFSPLHSVQYSIFLYLLSNTLYKNGLCKWGGGRCNLLFE